MYMFKLIEERKTREKSCFWINMAKIPKIFDQLFLILEVKNKNKKMLKQDNLF